MNLTLKALLPPLDFGWNHVRARCASTACHNKLLTRAVPQSRAGIHMGEQWFCSVDCFASAAQTELTVLSAGRILEMPRNPRLSVGLALLSRGYVTEDQLRFATDTSRSCGEDIETTLLRLGMAGEKELAGARAAQWGYPAFVQELPQVQALEFPRMLMRDFTAVPLHFSVEPRKLLLGFVQFVDHRLLQAVERVTGCRPEPCFMTPAEFEVQMHRIPAPDGYQETIVEEICTPGQMAKTLARFAIETGARQVSVARCKSWLWARLCGKRSIMDVLFSLRSTCIQPVPDSDFEVRETIGSLR